MTNRRSSKLTEKVIYQTKYVTLNFKKYEHKNLNPTILTIQAISRKIFSLGSLFLDKYTKLSCLHVFDNQIVFLDLYRVF